MPTSWRWLSLICCMALTCHAASTLRPSVQQNPRKSTSFLILLADDLDYGDVGYLGSLALTPNINGLANSNNALRLDNFHSASAVCSPSRAGLLSGRNPERSCILGALIGDLGYTFPLDMPSMARYAKNAGYRTALFGKWHISRDPSVLGFDEFDWTPASVPTFDPDCFCPEFACAHLGKKDENSDQCVKSKSAGRFTSLLSNQCTMGHMLNASTLGIDNWTCDMRQGTSENPLNSPPIDFTRNMTSADFLAGLATSFFDTVAVTESFFVEVTFHEPHMPFISSDWDRMDCISKKTCKTPIETYGFTSLVADFYAAVNSLDRAVGTIVKKLQTMNRFDDTLIIFASDNGGESPNMGGVPADTITRYLRGFKRSVYEGGTRVPAFILWPDKIQTNVRVVQPTSMLDIFPTVTEIILSNNSTAGDGEPTLPTDGTSWLPLIANATAWNRTRPFGICMPITSNNRQLCWTYAYHVGSTKLVVHGSNWAALEIFDTILDPQETTNLLKQTPKAVAKALSGEAKAWYMNITRDYALAGCPRSTRLNLG